MTYAQLKNYCTNGLAYIHNRWVNPKTHVHIRHPEFEKGHYYDADTRMLYANFQLLVDYVEIECGHTEHFQTHWQRWRQSVHSIPVIGWFIPPSRNIRQGLHYLRFCMKLKDEMPSQAAHGREVFRLYKWWTKTRPARLDPWTPYYILREHRDWKGSLTPKEKKLMDKCQRLEDRYDREDERNLIALIKIRKGLWT